MLDKPWAYGVDPNKQPSYQHVVDCTYWTVLLPFNNLNTIKFTNEIPSSEDFDSVHKEVLYGISENMASLVQLGKYGAINAYHLTKMGYYVIKYLYEPYTPQEYQTTYWQGSKAGEIVVRA